LTIDRCITDEPALMVSEHRRQVACHRASTPIDVATPEPQTHGR
jgi:hypothetical protein